MDLHYRKLKADSAMSIATSEYTKAPHLYTFSRWLILCSRIWKACMSNAVVSFVAQRAIYPLIVNTKDQCLVGLLVSQVHKLVSIFDLRWSNCKVLYLTHVGYCDLPEMQILILDCASIAFNPLDVRNNDHILKENLQRQSGSRRTTLSGFHTLKIPNGLSFKCSLPGSLGRT